MEFFFLPLCFNNCTSLWWKMFQLYQQIIWQIKMLISGKLHPLSQMNWDQSPVRQRFHKSSTPAVVVGESACGVTAAACAWLLWVATEIKNQGQCVRSEEEPTDEIVTTVWVSDLWGMKPFGSEYWLHGVSVGIILGLSCSVSLSPIDVGLNSQIYSGWRSCDVEVFTLKCMHSVQQEKYLVQTKRFNHYFLLGRGGTETQSWLRLAVLSQTWPIANIF